MCAVVQTAFGVADKTDTMRAPSNLRSPAQAASLMPIYAAILALIAMGLVGLAFAFWPLEPESPESRAGRSEGAASPRLAVDEGLRDPNEVRMPRTRMKSM